MFRLFVLSIFCFSFTAIAQKNQCSQLFFNRAAFDASLVEDFVHRDSMPETLEKTNTWSEHWSQWGPWPIQFHKPNIPPIYNSVSWKLHRIDLVAKKYIGLPYRHRHIPSLGGLDCSNFTSWVYNYGLGIYINSNVINQSQTAGRILATTEHLRKGDLLFFWNKDRTKISHVMIYLEEGIVIDSSRGGVQTHPLQEWREKNFAWARRIIE